MNSLDAISAMRKLITSFCLAACAFCAVAANEPAVTNTYVDRDGSVRILTADGTDHTIRPMQWQRGGGFTDVSIAPDRKTVGWVANQMLTPLEGGTNYAYAVGTQVEIWRGGKIIQELSPKAYVIQNWIFLNDGEQVAIHTAPPHGQEFFDCFRFDVRTGKELEDWSLDRRDYVVPEWAKLLLVNDPLPGPDEISDWVREAAKPTKHNKLVR